MCEGGWAVVMRRVLLERLFERVAGLVPGRLDLVVGFDDLVKVTLGLVLLLAAGLALLELVAFNHQRAVDVVQLLDVWHLKPQFRQSAAGSAPVNTKCLAAQCSTM